MNVLAKLLGSLLLALLLLLVLVLPAEYGKDLTGLGEKFGLTALTGVTHTEESTQAYEQVLEFNIEDYDTTAVRIERSINGLVRLEDAPFKNDTIVIELEELGQVEHKFIMQEGMSFNYSWKIKDAESALVYFDFHGHPQVADADKFPEGFEMSYSRNEGTGQNGAFRAPLSGLHGFFFRNMGGPVTIELKVSGYYDEHHEVYRAVDGKILKQLKL